VNTTKPIVAKLKNHPYADLFPMMSEGELDALTDDVKENGLHHPVVLYQGQVLDGRNRLLACEKAEVKPAFVEYEGDEASALALVLSLNAQRRDLTAGQKALTAARVWMLNGDGKPGRKSSGSRSISRAGVAKQFKTSGESVGQARTLLVNATDLADEVNAGTVTITAAYARWQERQAEARKRERVLRRSGKYVEAVEAGEMTFEEAVQKMAADLEEARNQESARHIWFEWLRDLLDSIARRVGDVDDESLAWYFAPGAPGAQHDVKSEDVAEMIRQLERVRSITLSRPA
jgi:hypothetical protein